MAKSALNSDDLGEKGQSYFQLICADAKLVCNKATRDRTGWDFIVEFPFSEIQGPHSLDSRSVPLSSHVQVKTLRAQNDRFEMRLSSAERLAKDIKPAFVYIAKVDWPNVIEAFLIHLIDDPLAAILRRLREENAAGNAFAINKKFIDFSARRYGTRIEPTGDALRAAIGEACGPNLHDYAARKRDQLRNLGFEPYRYRGTVRMRPQDLTDISDIYLGLKEFSVQEFRSFETRFGITLPFISMSSDDLVFKINPSPVDRCTVVLRHEELTKPCVLKADLLIPVFPVPPDKFKFLIKSELLSFEFTSASVSVGPAGDIANQRHRAGVWLDYWNWILAFTKQGGELEVSSDTGKVDLTVVIQERALAFDPEACTRWIALCERLSFLFSMAGVAPEPDLSLQEIGDNANEIFRAYSVLKGEGAHLSFSTSETAALTDLDPLRALFASYISLGNMLLVYSAVIDLVPEVGSDRVFWKPTRVVPRGIRSLRKAPGRFAAFVSEAIGEVEVDKVLVAREPEEPQRQD
jgi:hypothetical protein